MQRDFPIGKYYSVDHVTTDRPRPSKPFTKQVHPGARQHLGETLIHSIMVLPVVPDAKMSNLVSDIAQMRNAGGVADLVKISIGFPSLDPQSQQEKDIWKILPELAKAKGMLLHIANGLEALIKERTRFGKVTALPKKLHSDGAGSLGICGKFIEL
ncbi:hypothetical protein BJ742DRAFT_536636 [Cladochytrium replicatum]|nr:hypothetical protein BJ742DRAFT_536636 [Cladochytrium replicatum]